MHVYIYAHAPEDPIAISLRCVNVILSKVLRQKSVHMDEWYEQPETATQQVLCGAKSTCICDGRYPLYLPVTDDVNSFVPWPSLSECFRYMVEICGRCIHIHVRSRLAVACPKYTPIPKFTGQARPDTAHYPFSQTGPKVGTSAPLRPGYLWPFIRSAQLYVRLAQSPLHVSADSAEHERPFQNAAVWPENT